MQIEKYEFKDLHKLKKEWEKLEKGQDMTAFQSFNWNKLLSEEFYSNDYNRRFAKVIYYVLRHEGTVIAIAPLVIQKKTLKLSWFGRKKGIYILGIESYSDYLNFIYSRLTENELRYLVNFIKNEYSLPFFINNLRSNTIVADYLLQEQYKPYHCSTSVYVQIEQSVEDYNMKLSKSVRQNLRTALNRIKRDELDYKLESRGKFSEDDIVIVEKLLDLHKQRADVKNRKNDTDIFHKFSRILMYKYFERNDIKYNIVKNSMMRMDNSFVYIAKINNEIVGYLYGLKENKTIRIMQNCLDMKYKFYSPMFRGCYDLICSECSKDNDNKRIETIDFTRGTEKYKYDLAGKELELHNYKL